MIKKYITLITILIISLSMLSMVSLCGCFEKQESIHMVQEKIKITDMLGREVDVPNNVTRIVCIGPGCLRLITYLNATNKVVGVEDAEKKWSIYGRPYRISHPEFEELPTIGQGGPTPKPNTEEIINIQPNVIFACYITKEQADNLQQKTEIPVVVLSYGDLATFNNNEVFKSLEIAGKILSKEERAEKVIEFINNCTNDLNERTKNISNENKPTVYIGAIGFKGAHGIESTNCKYPPFEVIHANNVVGEVNNNGPLFVSKEQIMKWNPDVIFIDEGGLKLVIEDYRKNPKFYNSLKAFKNENVYGLLPYNYYTTNIGTAFADTYYIGKVIYPDKFKDIDPKEKADEIYSFLVGKPVYSVMEENIRGFKKLKFDKMVN